ncbi:MAG: AMP-binding protein [Blastomonas sp.]|uniref:AMP-binding protein n=1 Tax=Blastomonas sp. TaxID=1909299 RepID=UPI00258E6101|nr:AMP-binding protein [Blastomonas sp.]MCO5794772.1 AMP-binding protein [Blastomonas sp.]
MTDAVPSADRRAMQYRPLPFRAHDTRIEHREDGCWLFTPGYPAVAQWPSIPHLAIDRASRIPDAPLIARRALLEDGSRGAWQRRNYADIIASARSLAQALLDMNIASDRCIMVLSGASANHLVVNLAAQMARIPYAPVSVNYAMAGGDHARLRHCADVCRPQLVYADDWQQFLPAMRAISGSGDVILVTDEAAPAGESIALQELITAPAGEAVERSIAAITPDTHAKTIFTSGSTGKPKGVIQTQRMLTGVVAQHDAMYQHSERPLGTRSYLSWMPWSHVGGNNTLMADVLNDGACLYIDDGRPVPGQFGESIRNLHEISPSEFTSTPSFYSELVNAMEADPGLRERFFSQLNHLSFGAAGLSEDVFRRLQALSVAATGQGIPIIAKYGTSETQGTFATPWPIEQTGPIGLPFAGNVVKLAPVADSLEIRVKGLTVTPGYVNDPQATADAFDDEGFYRTGDAARLIDAAQPELGVVFDGRLSENFKLQSGTWVDVGNLRLALIAALDPLLMDAVILGEGEADVRALGWLRVADARALVGEPVPLDQLVAHPLIHAHCAAALARYNAAAGGQSRQIAALRLLATPPEGDEIADKGYINQREVMRQRPDDVRAAYRGEGILPRA